MAKDNTNTPEPGNTEFNVDSFFSSLEQQVNGAIFEQEPANPGKTKVENTKSERSDNDEVGDRSEDLKKLEKRYEDSSKEAKRLHGELQKYRNYDNYLPILEALRQDPGLINHVKSYLDNGGVSLPADFRFDPEEAFTNPNSDSAKFIQKKIDARVQDIVNQKLNQTKGELSQKEMIKDFQSKHKLSDDEISELLQWGDQTPMTLDDLLYLKNKGKNEEAVARRVQQDVQKQLEKMKGHPASLASLGSKSLPDNEEVEVFKMIKGAGGVNDVFSKF